MLNQIFRDFPPRFFAYCTSSMKITIRIPVAYLSLDQACIYITFEHIIKLNTQPKTTRISTRLYLLLIHLPHTKSKSDKGENSLTSYLHHKRRSRKRLHDIPDFYSVPRTRNINYNKQNMQHLFTFLAPRNLGRHSHCFSRSTSG